MIIDFSLLFQSNVALWDLGNFCKDDNFDSCHHAKRGLMWKLFSEKTMIFCCFLFWFEPMIQHNWIEKMKRFYAERVWVVINGSVTLILSLVAILMNDGYMTRQSAIITEIAQLRFRFQQPLSVIGSVLK